jgi:predicted NAD/FAD-dependent oxidoreductase
MTAIAKVLAEGLDVQLGQRVEQLDLIEPSHWQLTIAPASEEEPVKTLTAKTVVMAIPAPQALVLLEKVRSWLPPDFVQQVAAVQFAPCLSVMAGYNPACAADWLRQYPDVKAITLSEHPELAYLGYDSSKRETPAQPVFVMQSSAVFADRYLDAGDLQPAAHQLLQAAAAFAPWLASPEWMQVHRWRYAFAQSPLPTPYLATQAAKLSPPLVCTGDWCGGATVEAAFLAGLATAAFLKGSTLPSSNAL